MTEIDLLARLGDLSISVGVLILAVLIIRRPFARIFGPQAAYLLWLAPAARLFLPDLNILPLPSIEQTALLVETNAAPLVLAPGAEPPAPSFSWTLLLTTAFYLWIAVAFAWLNILLGAQRKFVRNKIAASQPADAQLARQAQEIAQSLRFKGVMRLRISAHNDGPMTVGLVRPIIFLPKSFETNYSAEERRLALTHEIAHMARGDMMTALAATLFRVLHWPNPLVHFAYKAFRTDQEAACDAYVMRRETAPARAAHDYAAAIVKSLRFNNSGAAHSLALAYPIKERLMLLKNPARSPKRRFFGNAAAVFLIAAGLTATASYGYAAAKEGARQGSALETQEIKETQESKKTKIEKRVKSKQVISVDGDEELIIEGFEGKKIRKVIVENDNGERKVSVYNKKGKLVREQIIGPDEEMKTGVVTIKSADGKSKVIALNDGDRAVNFFAHDLATTDCTAISDNGGDMEVYSWTSDDASDETTTIVAKEIVCVTSDDPEALPEDQARSLRQTIKHLKEEGERSEKRRKATIKKLEKRLKEVESKK